MSEEQLPPSERGREQQPQPSIYVASLSDYNAGRLHGAWIEADQTPEALHAAIGNMLATSPEPGAEEWAIHDFEGFGPLRLSEHESVEHVAAVAHGITEHGPAFAAWAAHIDSPDELSRFEDCFMGHWESIVAYAQGYIDDVGVEDAIEKAAGPLAAYVHIDADALAEDMLYGGYVSVADAPDGGVFIFEA